ncbi:sigma-70 family RNA polymerase sigma factor [Eleftheria terrae]|uniref:sigma-70 family RNA polymerase sigma factor n=1 Tax=Eleftheria terrae TaxID=1597781 RepID=UPI00263BDAB8|nr:sigma-70 family RNA polymerase sigma factor [Eleftheria terrae]WKB50754.1 sigma-70 family RNA polymerase sigma factor [Eleftheria terrae]
MSEPKPDAPRLNRLFRTAIVTGVESAVRLHIERGDDLNARDDKGLTALMIAASHDRAGICELLLQAGADPTARDPAGNDALFHAKRLGAQRAAERIAAAVSVTGAGATAVACPQEDSHPPASGVTLPIFRPASPLPEFGPSAGQSGEQRASIALSNSAPAGAPSGGNHGVTPVPSPGDNQRQDVMDLDELTDGFGSGLPAALDAWEAEEDRPAPVDDRSVAEAAAAIQASISLHAPVDSSAAWDDIEVILPHLAAPLPSAEGAKGVAELRRLVLRAVREGSVPLAAVEDLSLDPEQDKDAAGKVLLRIVLNDLGAEIDDRVEYRSPFDNFEVFVDPDETSEEEAAVSDALAFLDDLRSNRNDPVRLYMRDLHRKRLVTAEEEIALAQAMERGVDEALDALSAWPAGLQHLVVAADSVRRGARPMSWITAEAGDDVPPEEDAGDAAGIEDVGRPRSSQEGNGSDDEPGVELEDRSADPVGFLRRIADLANMCGAAALPIEIRRTLAELRITRQFLLDLCAAASEDRTASASRFSSAVRAYRDARDRLTDANLKLVLTVARRYHGLGVPMEDLLQEGNIGLLKAVDKFDWRRGLKFSTMAIWWIRQQVSRSVADKSLLIRLPVHMFDTARRILREDEDFERETGRRAPVKWLAERLSLPIAKIGPALRATSEPLPVEALDLEPGIENRCNADPFEHVAALHLRRTLDVQLRGLGAKQEQVLRMRFGFGLDDALTLEEVGEKYQVTRERIRQIEAAALRDLRHPHRSGSLAAWLGKDPSSVQQGEHERDSDAARKMVGRGALPSNARGARRQRMTVEASSTPEEPAKPSALARLLERCLQNGIPVEDLRQQHGAGSVWVYLNDPEDSTLRRLARDLMAMGFEHWPGKGYWR